MLFLMQSNSKNASTLFEKGRPRPKLSIELRHSLLDDDGWSNGAPSEGGERRMGVGGGGSEMSREELLQLYVMKLDEEANYFKATSPVEEEFCNCPKCQVRKNPDVL